MELGDKMKLEDIQRTIDALKEQGEVPYAVIMSPENFKHLQGSLGHLCIITPKEPLVLFGVRIETFPLFPEGSILCVTEDGYEKIKKGYTEESLPQWIKNLI
jgi:hypothetical protein